MSITKLLMVEHNVGVNSFEIDNIASILRNHFGLQVNVADVGSDN